MSFNMFNINKKNVTGSKSNISIRSGGSSGKNLYLAPPFVKAQLVHGSLRKLVNKPQNVDKMEWIVANAFDFYNSVNLYFQVVASEACLEDNPDCTVMNAGAGFEYQWIDPQKRSTNVPAPQYVNFALTSIQAMFEDENLFPTKAGVPFPRDVEQAIGFIFKHLFRILAHIYVAHFDVILHLELEPELNTLFAHFVCFVDTFNLIEAKELQPLHPLIGAMQASGSI